MEIELCTFSILLCVIMIDLLRNIIVEGYYSNNVLNYNFEDMHLYLYYSPNDEKQIFIYTFILENLSII